MIVIHIIEKNVAPMLMGASTMGSRKENTGKMDASRDTKSPKPWSPTDTSKWRSLSPDSWCFSDEGLYVSNIASFKKRYEQCQKARELVGSYILKRNEKGSR